MGVEPVGECLEGAGIAEGVDEKLVRIDDQRPVPVSVFPLEPGDPIHPEPSSLIARSRPPERDIRLAGKVLGAAIVAIIVDQQKMPDPKIAVVFQEIGKADIFVADRRKQKDVVWLDLLGAINVKRKLPALAK